MLHRQLQQFEAVKAQQPSCGLFDAGTILGVQQSLFCSARMDCWADLVGLSSTPRSSADSWWSKSLSERQVRRLKCRARRQSTMVLTRIPSKLGERLGNWVLTIMILNHQEWHKIGCWTIGALLYFVPGVRGCISSSSGHLLSLILYSVFVMHNTQYCLLLCNCNSNSLFWIFIKFEDFWNVGDNIWSSTALSLCQLWFNGVDVEIVFN